MIILDWKKMELPEWDVVKATPIRIPLDEDKDGKALLFNIPSVEQYFNFEALYMEFIIKNFVLLSNVKFMELEEFSDMALKEKMITEFRKVMQTETAKNQFKKIILKYFICVNFKKRKLLKTLNPMQFSYIILFIHKCIETVKKKFQLVAREMDPGVLRSFSTSSSGTSTKAGPRFFPSQ